MKPRISFALSALALCFAVVLCSLGALSAPAAVPVYFNQQFRSMAADAGIATNNVVSLPQTNLFIAADFRAGGNIISTAPMGTNLTIRLTNIVQGATVRAYLTGGTNGGPFTVTVSTNGVGNLAVRWGILSPTNGATTITVTNAGRAEIEFFAPTTNEVWAIWRAFR